MKTIYSFVMLLAMSFLAVACSNDLDEMEQTGYLKLELQTLVSTNTKAVTNVPNGYDAKTLAVKVTDSNGNVVAETNDFDNDATMKKALELTPGEYTITASSAGWDGSGSGFNAPYYAGSTKATVAAKSMTKAQLTLTQANVKVTVNFAENLGTYFTSANCIVSSATTGVAAQTFDFKTSTGSAYFPVADLKFFLALTNKKGESFSMEKTVTDVKARDHYIINYKIADAGSLGGVTVKVDDATQEYSFDVEIPRKAGTALEVRKANAWSTFADLSGEVTSKTQDFDESLVKLQWKKAADADWNDVPVSSLTKSGEKYTYRLKNLEVGAQYVYRMAYLHADAPVYSNEETFTTETQTQIENAGFENWYKSGRSWYPGNTGELYWGTSNPGSTSIGEKYNVTTQDTEFKHGGTSSARLGTQWVVMKMAAASLYTGQFVDLIGMEGAMLDWGVPFTSRPTALKGYFNFKPGNINRVSDKAPASAPAKDQLDKGQIFCALLTEQLHVGGNATGTKNGINYENSTLINWNTDPRIIAYGEKTLENTTTAGQWETLNIPLTYHSLTAKPKYMLIVASANKWGDYFHGCDANVLYLDDFSFEYGEPTVK